MLNPLNLNRDIRLIKKSGLFDPIYYLEEYPDVGLADIDPLMHFVKFGWKENRNPTADFDTNFYLSENLDEQSAQTNPLIHFIKFGFNEGRKTSSTFDIHCFLENHPYFHRIHGIDSIKHLYLAESQDSIESNQPQNIPLEKEAKEHSLIGNPKISIIVPVFNAKEFTIHCLEKIIP